MNIPEDILNTLTEEQRTRAAAAQSAEELLTIAKEAGYELSEDQLAEVSGGVNWSCISECQKDSCPRLCGLFGH